MLGRRVMRCNDAKLRQRRGRVLLPLAYLAEERNPNQSQPDEIPAIHVSPWWVVITRSDSMDPERPGTQSIIASPVTKSSTVPAPGYLDTCAGVRRIAQHFPNICAVQYR